MIEKKPCYFAFIHQTLHLLTKVYQIYKVYSPHLMLIPSPVLHLSTKVLWANTQYVGGMQKFCKYTQNLWGFVSKCRVSWECFGKVLQSCPGKCKFFIRECKVCQGSSKVLYVSTKIAKVWEWMPITFFFHYQFCICMQKFCEWMQSLSECIVSQVNAKVLRVNRIYRVFRSECKICQHNEMVNV